jgi:hypothetical protein
MAASANKAEVRSAKAASYSLPFVHRVVAPERATVTGTIPPFPHGQFYGMSIAKICHSPNGSLDKYGGGKWAV